jgi:hypothetical protein
MAPNYSPRPLHLTHVLSSELEELVELLAKNAHELWAAQRISDGWTYGPTRNDQSLLHPCLVPYEDLPESERSYDRNWALSTVRAIIALGFVIEKR